MLIVRDRGVAIAMIYVNRTTTVVIQVKYLFVTMVFPPHTQLAIPRTGQDIKLQNLTECKNLDRAKCHLNLYFSPSFLTNKMSSLYCSYKCMGASYETKVQKEDAAVESWVTVRRGLSNFCPRMVPSICPGDMFVDRLLFMSYSDYVCRRKLFKFREELFNVCVEFQVCVQHDKFGDVGK